MIWGGVDILRAGAASLEILETLHAECFAVGWDAVSIAKMLAMPGATGTLAVISTGAEREATPAGFLLGREAGGEAEIISTGVVPALRGRGIGGALVSEFTSRMRQRGVHVVFLEVAVDNEPALSLYKRIGFAPVGLRKSYYEPARDKSSAGPTDALVMRCNL